MTAGLPVTPVTGGPVFFGPDGEEKMNTVSIRHRKWIKTIALIVTVLFTLNNISWARPLDNEIDPDTLQVQSMFNPITDIKEKNLQAQLKVELRAVIAQAKRGIPFQDINSEFDEGYSGNSAKDMKRLVDVITNPSLSEDKKEVSLTLEIMDGPYEGAIFTVLADTDTLDIIAVNGRPTEKKEAASKDKEEISEKKDAEDHEETAQERADQGKDILRDIGKKFLNNLLIFITAATVIMSSWTARGAEAASLGPHFNVDLDHDLNGTVVEIELDEAMGADIGVGALSGNQEFSPLGTSPYFHIGYDNQVERRDFIDIIDARISVVDLQQRETENIGVNLSVFGGHAKAYEIGKNTDLNLGWALGSSLMWMDDGYGYYVHRPEIVLGSEIDFYITPEDRLTFGGSASAVIASGDVRDQEISTYEIFPGENRLSLGYSTLRGRHPFDIGVDYRTTPLEESLGVYADIHGTDSGISFGMTAEQSKSKHGAIPDRMRYGLNVKKDLKSGASLEVGGYRDDLNDENVVTAGLRFDFWGPRYNVSAGYGGNRFTQGGLGAWAGQDSGINVDYRKFGEIRRAFQRMSFDEFLHGYIPGNINTIEDIAALMKYFGGIMHDSYGELEDPLSNEEIYNTLRDHPGADIGVCRNAGAFLADLVNGSGIEGIRAYAPSVRNGGAHIVTMVETPEGIYIADYESVHATGARDLDEALQIYQIIEGTVRPSHDLYEDGEFVAQIDTPDTRVLKRGLTVMGDSSVTDNLRSRLFDRLRRNRFHKRAEKARRRAAEKKEVIKDAGVEEDKPASKAPEEVITVEPEPAPEPEPEASPEQEPADERTEIEDKQPEQDVTVQAVQPAVEEPEEPLPEEVVPDGSEKEHVEEAAQTPSTNFFTQSFSNVLQTIEKDLNQTAVESDIEPASPEGVSKEPEAVRIPSKKPAEMIIKRCDPVWKWLMLAAAAILAYFTGKLLGRIDDAARPAKEEPQEAPDEKNKSVEEAMSLSEGIDQKDRAFLMQSAIIQQNVEALRDDIKEINDELYNIKIGWKYGEQNKKDIERDHRRIKELKKRQDKMQGDLKDLNFLYDMLEFLTRPGPEELREICARQDGYQRYDLAGFQEAFDNYLARLTVLKEAGMPHGCIVGLHTLSYYKKLFRAPSMDLEKLRKRAENLREMGLTVKQGLLTYNPETLREKAGMLLHIGMKVDDRTIRTPISKLEGMRPAAEGMSLARYLPGLERFNYPKSRKYRLPGDNKKMTIRQALERAEPYPGYRLPVFKPGFSREMMEKQLVISQYGWSGASMKVTLDDIKALFPPEVGGELDRIYENGPGKSANIAAIELLWDTNDVLLKEREGHDGRRDATLLGHAEREWKMINGYINGRADFADSILFPAPEPERLLDLYQRHFGKEFEGLAGKKRALELFAHLLLLHDLGKWGYGNKGHEKRSEEIVEKMFRGDYFDLTAPEKNLLRRIIGFHSQVDWINKKEENRKTMERIVKETAREGYPEEDLLDFLKVLVVFRMTELSQGEHFGFIGEKDMENFSRMYRTIKSIVEKEYSDIKGARKTIKRTDTYSKQLFRAIESYVEETAAEGKAGRLLPPVDFVVDLSLIPDAEDELENNMRTIAGLVLMCRKLGNVNFVLERRSDIASGETMTEDLERRAAEAPGVEKALAVLREEIKRQAMFFDPGAPEGLEELINVRVRSARTPGGDGRDPIEIPVTSRALLEWARDRDIDLADNQYPIAMEGPDSGADGKKILRNFQAALVIGLSKAALVIAKRKADRGEKGAEQRLRELKKEVLSRLNDLYGAIRKDVTLTEKTLDRMIDHRSVHRLNRAIELAIPPITRVPVNMLKDLHEAIQMAVRSA